MGDNQIYSDNETLCYLPLKKYKKILFLQDLDSQELTLVASVIFSFPLIQESFYFLCQLYNPQLVLTSLQNHFRRNWFFN